MRQVSSDKASATRDIHCDIHVATDVQNAVGKTVPHLLFEVIEVGDIFELKLNDLV